jgi:uncharacterized protein YozE (UPF0346 family)
METGKDPNPNKEFVELYLIESVSHFQDGFEVIVDSLRPTYNYVGSDRYYSEQYKDWWVYFTNTEYWLPQPNGFPKRLRIYLKSVDANNSRELFAGEVLSVYPADFDSTIENPAEIHKRETVITKLDNKYHLRQSTLGIIRVKAIFKDRSFPRDKQVADCLILSNYVDEENTWRVKSSSHGDYWNFSIEMTVSVNNDFTELSDEKEWRVVGLGSVTNRL